MNIYLYPEIVLPLKRPTFTEITVTGRSIWDIYVYNLHQIKRKG
jgi:hypothetical protein